MQPSHNLTSGPQRKYDSLALLPDVPESSISPPALIHVEPRFGEDILDEEAVVVPEEWSNSLVGFFVGSKPPYPVVRDSLTIAWRSLSGVEFSTLDNDFYRTF